MVVVLWIVCVLAYLVAGYGGFWCVLKVHDGFIDRLYKKYGDAAAEEFDKKIDESQWKLPSWFDRHPMVNSVTILFIGTLVRILWPITVIFSIAYYIGITIRIVAKYKN